MSWDSYKSDVSAIVTNSKSKLTTVFEYANTINATSENDYNVGAYSISTFDQILSHSETLINYINSFNDMLTNRGIDIVLLSEQADTFVCNSIDAFDRLIDIRSYCIDDTLMSKLLKRISDLKIHYIDKLSYSVLVTDNTTHIAFDNDETFDTVNNAFFNMFTELNLIINEIDAYTGLVSLANGSLDNFSKILRVNTTVGTALSVSSKCWHLAIKLNKNNYKTTASTEEQNIISEKQSFANYPIDNFPQFPKYIKMDLINKYIDELDFLNISNNIKINLTGGDYLETIVTTDTAVTEISDPGFNLARPVASDLDVEIDKFFGQFDTLVFENIVKNSFIMNNYEDIKKALNDKDIVLAAEVLTDDIVLENYLKLGYNLKSCLIDNLKSYLTVKNDHNTIHKYYVNKYYGLNSYPEYSTIGLKFEQYVPIGLFDNAWLYSVALSNNKNDALNIYKLIEDAGSNIYDSLWADKLLNYKNLMYKQLLGYTSKTEHKIITLYHRTSSGTTTLLKRVEVNWNIVYNILENAGGLINQIGPITRATDFIFKYKNEITFYLSDRYLNLDNPLYTDTRTFAFYGKYDISLGVRKWIWFSLNEEKRLTDGYEGKLDIFNSLISSARDGDKVFITGPVSIQHIETSYITDNPVIRIATNVANIYRELLIDGKIGYNDARFKAIFYTLKYLRFKEAFDAIIDRSWELDIPRYLID